MTVLQNIDSTADLHEDYQSVIRKILQLLALLTIETHSRNESEPFVFKLKQLGINAQCHDTRAVGSIPALPGSKPTYHGHCGSFTRKIAKHNFAANYGTLKFFELWTQCVKLLILVISIDII